MSRHQGFTIIELLLVISIISFIGSVIFATMSSARGRARDARRLADMRSTVQALEFYLDENGQYPEETTVGAENIAGWEASVYPNFMEYLQPYIRKQITDPVNRLIAPPQMFYTPRPDDGNFWYVYYRYPAGPLHGCAWDRPYAVLAVRAFEAMDAADIATLPSAKCGPQPCGGPPPAATAIANVCRDWSGEYDYSLFIL